MMKTQMELGLENRSGIRMGQIRRDLSLSQARWWFDQMRAAVYRTLPADAAVALKNRMTVQTELFSGETGNQPANVLPLNFRPKALSTGSSDLPKAA